MAGTLTISTLSDGTNSTSSTNCIQGSAKAWVNWDGTGTTIRASYNVSSITRSSAGVYVVNFTNAFADNKYSVIGTAKYVGSAQGQNVRIGTAAYATAVTTTSVAVETTSAGNAANADSEMVNVAVFR
jgi:hypothetical protein